MVFITVYADDLLIACREKEIIVTVKKLFGNKFSISDKGQLHHYLSIEVEREVEFGSISICQSQYIRKNMVNITVKRLRTIK